MIGISEDCLGAEGSHLLHCKSLDRGTRGCANKGRRPNVAVWRMNHANASQAVLFLDIKL